MSSKSDTEKKRFICYEVNYKFFKIKQMFFT